MYSTPKEIILLFGSTFIWKILLLYSQLFVHHFVVNISLFGSKFQFTIKNYGNSKNLTEILLFP